MAELTAKTLGGNHTQIREAELETLKEGFRGELIREQEVGYDQARSIWNGMLDHRPALIARCRGVADVTAAVNFAREHNLLTSVRGGGHNVSGKAVCEGGLMIDLSKMTAVQVDPRQRVARAEPGTLLRHLDRETQAFGLAVPAGTVSETGIAGLTLGGGMGWLSRKYGLTCDSLIGADLVTADGSFIQASETENQDLLWGLRGGGGNFGIVTSFKYRAYEVGPTVLAGFVLHPIEDAIEFLRFYSQFILDTPDELTTIPSLRILPPLPSVPKDLHGRRVVGVSVCWSGDLEAGERVLKPLKEFGSPLVDSIAHKPFVDHQSTFDAGAPAGNHYYEKSELLPPLNENMIEVLVAYGSTVMSPYTFIGLFQLGGAVSRIKEADTAFTHREAAYSLVISASWVDPDLAGKNIDWARRFWQDIQPHSTGGVYVNFLSEDDGHDRVKAAYGADKYQRLVALKDKYDPDNFFRLNQNIQPSN